MRVNPVLDQLKLGDHVCCPISDTEQSWAVAAAGTACGLRDGQKVLFFVDDPDGLRRFLATTVEGAGRALASQQLQVRAGAGAYGTGHGFDSEEALDFVASEVELAERQGFAGLRGTGDLSTIAHQRRNIDAVIDYERRLNAIVANGRIINICHYDHHGFSPSTWRRILSTHPTTLLPTGSGTVIRLRGTRTATGIRLIGTIDLLNQEALPGLLAEVVSLPGVCRIDATGLEFVDAQAIGCLLRTARNRTGQLTTIVCGRHLAEILAICGAAAVPDLTVMTTGA